MGRSKKEQVMERLGKEFMDRGWVWRNGIFQNVCFPYINGVRIDVVLRCTFTTVGAMIDTESDYGIANEEQSFSGETAIEECLEWAAEKAIEKSEIVNGRVKPYQQGHEEYLRALKGAYNQHRVWFGFIADQTLLSLLLKVLKKIR